MAPHAAAVGRSHRSFHRGTRHDNAPRQEMSPVLHTGRQLPILLGEYLASPTIGLTDAKN
jgi:hypothetical protein